MVRTLSSSFGGFDVPSSLLSISYLSNLLSVQLQVPLSFNLVLLAYGLLMADSSHVHVSLHRCLNYPLGVMVPFIVTPFDVPNIYLCTVTSIGRLRSEEPMGGLD